MLKAHGVTLLVDVRRFPGSRRHPQFNQGTFYEALLREGIRGRHEPRLGGRRKVKADSINAGLRNDGFRGYADHMQTREFEEALEELIREGRQENVAILCAEAVPWRCHRNLIADALVARGVDVRHLLGESSVQTHRILKEARREGPRLFYPPPGRP